MAFPMAVPIIDARRRYVHPDMTVSRGSAKRSRYRGDGVARTIQANTLPWDTDPVTGEDLGLRPEPLATNYAFYSHQLDNAAYLKSGCSVTANTATGADGAGTLDKLVEDTSTGSHYIRQACSFPSAGLQACLSWEVVAAERTRGMLQLVGGTDGANLAFDLGAGTASAPVVFGATASAVGGIVPLGGGLFLPWVSCIPNGTSTALSARLYITDSAGLTTYTGGGAAGLHAGAAMFEVGAYPTTAVATAGASASRLADALAVPLGRWHNPSEWSLRINARAARGVGTQVLAQLDDGTANNRVCVYRDTSRGMTVLVIAGGVTVATLALGALGDAADGRVSLSVKGGLVAGALNGGAPVFASPAALPAGLTTYRPGNDHGAANQWGGWMPRHTYFPRAVAPSDLQAA